MASELLKNRALIQRLKEPKLPTVDFSLSTASFESTLPEPKPQELLDIQENVRIQRQQDTMNKARPFLMDESVDFIERENFATKGIPGRGADYFTDRITDPTTLKFLDEAAKKYGYKSWSEVPITKQTVPGKRIQGDRERVLREAKRRQEGVLTREEIYKKRKGVVPEIIKKGDLYSPEIIEKRLETIKSNYQASPIGERLQWIADNGKNYDNPKTFIKAYEKHFKHKLGAKEDALFNPTILKKEGRVKLNNIDNLINTGKASDIFFIKPNFSEEEIFKASIIQNNPKIKKQFKNLFKEIHKNVSEYEELGPESTVKKLKNQGGNLLKDFDFIDSYNTNATRTIGGVHTGVTRNSLLGVGIPNEHIVSFQMVRQPILPLAEILLRLKSRPKEMGKMFNLSSSVAKKLTSQLDNFIKGQGEIDSIVRKINYRLGDKKFNQIFGGVNFEHTLAKQFGKDYKYLPRNYLLKGQFTSKDFNLFKRDVFDLPLIKLMKEYEAGKISGQKVQDFIDDFNAKTNNYADFSFNPQKKKLEYTDNKVKYDLSRYTNPGVAKEELIKNIELTMSPEFQKGFKKNRFEDFEGVNKRLKSFRSKEAKQILELIKSIGCPNNKADGGRIGFQDGTSCFKKGQKVLNEGRINPGSQSRNITKIGNIIADYAKKTGTSAIKASKILLKGLVVPEAVIIGLDTGLRYGMGDTLNEAWTRALGAYDFSGGLEQQATDQETVRMLGADDAQVVLNARKVKREQDKLTSLEGEYASELALAGTDFTEMTSGRSQSDVVQEYEKKLQEQRNNLDRASYPVSEAAQLEALAGEAEYEDIKGISKEKSPVYEAVEDMLKIKNVPDPVREFFRGRRTVDEPNISAQKILDTYTPLSYQDKPKQYNKLINTFGPEVVLEAIKKFESAQKFPEGAVRDPNVFDRERELLFEQALDPENIALRERLFGASQMFGGEAVGRTDLEPGELPMYDEAQSYKTDRFAEGGITRLGFKDGPKNPGRRTFLKVMGGIASLPVVGKLFKGGAPIVEKLVNTPTKMPDWFPNFIDKFIGRSIGKKIDADLMEYKNPDLPGVTVTRSDDGRVYVEGTNEYNETYQIEYEPPGYELVDPKTGQAVKTPGNFEAVEGRHVAVGPEDYDVEAYYPADLDEIAAGDIRSMEKYATGKVSGTVKDAMGKDTGLKKGEYDLNMAEGRAEAEADIARDLDDYYED